MDESIKVSLVVPVYNAEEYLPECLSCLLQQSYSDYEILLIDDGSTDGSAEVCDEYAQKDNRIRTFHQRNQGVSAARNCAIAAAKGEFIGFVDADDLIHPDLIRSCVDVVRKTGADVVSFGYEFVAERKMHMDAQCCINDDEYATIDKTEIIKELFNKWISGFLWNKIYRTEMIRCEKLDQSLRICEDLEFNFRIAYKRAPRIVYLKKSLYGYYQNPRGASKTQVLDDSGRMAFLPAYEKMIALARAKDDQIMLGWLEKKRNDMELLTFLNLYGCSPEAYYEYKEYFLKSKKYLPKGNTLTFRQLVLVWLEMIKPNLSSHILEICRRRP